MINQSIKVCTITMTAISSYWLPPVRHPANIDHQLLHNIISTSATNTGMITHLVSHLGFGKVHFSTKDPIHLQWFGSKILSRLNSTLKFKQDILISFPHACTPEQLGEGHKFSTLYPPSDQAKYSNFSIIIMIIHMYCISCICISWCYSHATC